MAISPDVHEQSIGLGEETDHVPNSSSPRITVSPVDDSIVEGGIARFRIERKDVETTACAVRWRVSTDVDVIVGPTSLVVTFDPGDVAVVVPIELATLDGEQGERFLTMSLEDPLGCILDPIGSTAQIRVADLIPEDVGFRNGFTYRIRVRLLAYGSGNAAGSIFWFNETLPVLKAVANGGAVASAVAVVGPPARVIPYDIRFELGGDSNGQGGTKLSHRIRAYDPATGRCIGPVRLPNPNLNIENDVWCYFGRVGCTASEEDIPGVGIDHLSWHTFPQGVDVAKGRNLTVTGVTADTFQQGPAGRWAASTELATVADASYVGGLSNVSFWIMYDGEPATLGVDRGLFMQGVIGLPSTSGGFSIAKMGNNPTPDCVVLRLACSDGVHTATTVAGSYKVTPQMLGFSRSPGQAFTVVIDGVPQLLAASVIKSGTTVMVAGQPIQVGVGPNNSVRFSGLIVECGIINKALLAHVWQLFQRSFLKPRQAYGIGIAEALGDAPSHVAMPVVSSTLNINTLDVDVVAKANIPAGQVGALSTLSNPVGGTFSNFMGAIRYQPTAGFVGEASVNFAIAANSVESVSQLTIAVSQLVAPVLPLVGVTADQPTIQESTDPIMFMVTRSGNLAVTSSITWTKTGTTSAADFSAGQAFTGLLSFAAGEEAKPIILSQVINVDSPDVDETVIITLSSPVQCTIDSAANSALTTVRPAPAPAPVVVGVLRAQAVVTESVVPVVFNVNRTGDTTTAATVSWTKSGTTNAADFASGQIFSGTLTFGVGQTSKQITLNLIVSADSPDVDETIVITLSNPIGCSLDSSATVATTTVHPIAAVLPSVGIVADVGTVAEAAVSVSFTVQRTGDTTGTSTVSWTKSGTTNAADFVSGEVFSGTLTFSPGQVEKTIAFDLLVNTESPKVDETIIVTLSSPSGCTLATGGSSATTTVLATAGPWDFWQTPHSKDAAHHRMIGEGATYGYPGGVFVTDFKAGRRNYQPAGALNDHARLRSTCGQIRLSTDNSGQGRKSIYKVVADDPDEVMHQVVENTHNRTGATVSLKMPAASDVKYWTYTGADFQMGFFPRNGDPKSKLIDTFTNFNYADREYTNHEQFKVDGVDFGGGVGAAGASRLKFPPSGVLRGFEVNPTNPGPILHCLQCTATRHNGQGGTDACQFLNADIAWPAWGTDKSANPDPDNEGYNPAHNHGFLPYGTKVCIQRGADYNAAKAAIGNNPRGLALLDCMTYFGMYIVDGQGQIVTVGGEKKGVLIVRADNLVGLTTTGGTIANVISDCVAGLTAMIPWLSCVRNPRLHNSERERAADGLCYAGGGGRMIKGGNGTTNLPAKYKITAWDV